MAYDGTLRFNTDIDIKGFQDGLDKIGKKSEEVGKAMAPVSIAAGGIATGLAAMAVSAGKSADDLNTLSKITGISTGELQKFQYASDIIDVSLETFTGSLTKLTRGMGEAYSGNAEMNGAFERLGISITNTDGSLRNSQDVFYEAIDALALIENTTLRDSYAMEIFGKSAQDLNPLILGGSESLKALGLEAESLGLILSQEALDGANAFNDTIDRMSAISEKTKNVVGANLGEALIPIMESLSASLIKISEWLQKVDGDTLLWVLQIGGLVAIISPLLIGIGQMATGISALLKLLPLAKTGVTALGGALSFLAANPIALVIAAVGALVAGIMYLWDTNEDFRKFFIDLWEDIKTKFGDIVDWFKGKIEDFKNIGKNLIEGLWQGFKDGLSNFKNKMVDGFNGIVDTAKKALGINSPSVVFKKEIGINMADGATEGWSQGIKGFSSQINSDLTPTSIPTISNNNDSWSGQLISEMKALRDEVKNQPYTERNIGRLGVV